MVYITEVGPRDGLQNEKKIISVDEKVAFINALSHSGVHEIEVTSFVSPKWVPQFQDAVEVCQRIERLDGVSYSALVPNAKGFDRALEAGVDRIAIFSATSETFSQKNTNGSVREVLRRYNDFIPRSLSAHIPVRGYISTVFACPYEGKTDAQKTLELALELLDLGCDFIALGDTLGQATGPEVRELLDILVPALGTETLVMHFHDTHGEAANNVRISVDYGIKRFDASVGGLGGCPYAGPGAVGNVSTQKIIDVLREKGEKPGVDENRLRKAEAVIQQALQNQED